MTTGKKRKERAANEPLEQRSPVLCDCVQLSPPHNRATWDVRTDGPSDEREQSVLVSSALNEQLCNALEDYFPRNTPFSLIVMHISQLEPMSLMQSELHQRHYSHPASGVLEQILVYVKRVIRTDDRLLLQQESGAVLLLPDVDQQGAQAILERIYQSISFLQAEMIVPPLAKETTILLGMGSYPEPALSLVEVCSHSGHALRNLTLRPALPSLHLMPDPYSQPQTNRQVRKKRSPEETFDVSEVAHPGKSVPTVIEGPGIPSLNLPRELPKRLKHLIPYPVAQELRCVPVGRDHHTLTVAMADPTHSENVRLLQELVGMTIFPVACEIDDLNRLLEKKW